MLRVDVSEWLGRTEVSGGESSQHDRHSDASHLSPTPRSSIDGGRTVLAVWLSVAGLLPVVYLGRLSALRRRLRARERVDDACVVDALDGLSRRAGLNRPPRLTHSDQLGVRVDRLINERRVPTASSPSAWIVAVALVAIAPWLAPGIAAGASEHGEHSSRTEHHDDRGESDR